VLTGAAARQHMARGRRRTALALEIERAGVLVRHGQHAAALGLLQSFAGAFAELGWHALHAWCLALTAACQRGLGRSGDAAATALELLDPRLRPWLTTAWSALARERLRARAAARPPPPPAAAAPAWAVDLRTRLARMAPLAGVRQAGLSADAVAPPLAADWPQPPASDMLAALPAALACHLPGLHRFLARLADAGLLYSAAVQARAGSACDGASDAGARPRSLPARPADEMVSVNAAAPNTRRTGAEARLAEQREQAALRLQPPSYYSLRADIGAGVGPVDGEPAGLGAMLDGYATEGAAIAAHGAALPHDGVPPLTHALLREGFSGRGSAIDASITPTAVSLQLVSMPATTTRTPPRARD
jgi:hypothetical protein